MSRRLRSVPGRRRAVAFLGAAVIVAATLGVMARGDGFEDSRVELSGGGAWLPSVSQRLVTLIDGASEQVVGSVQAPAARPGDALSIVQAGTSAYVTNDTRGTVSRVDGATYETTEPVRFGAEGGGSLRVFAGGTALYVVDGQRRTASVTDPLSLRVRDRLSLTAQPGPEQAVVDGAGRLWVIDRGQGGLTWFDGGKRVRPDVAEAGTRLTLVQGRPVLVDTARSRVGTLSGEGTVDTWSCLEVRAGDDAQVLGSQSSPRVFAAVSATGMLVISAVGRDDCGRSVEVGRANDRFGPLVEVGGFVFVPNRTTGRTIVVDVAAGQVAADLAVVKPGARLELLAKDGFVFYNDLDGDQAGVIRFEGGVWRKGRSLTKYDEGDTGKGILTPVDEPPGKEPPAEDPEGNGGKDPRPPAEEPNPPPGGPQPPPPPGGPPPQPPAPGGPVTLTVVVDGPGSVFADSPAPIGLPAGVECAGNSTCAWRFPDDTPVVLRVPEQVGEATLQDVQGCRSESSTGGTTRCELTLTDPATVRAVFKSPDPPAQVRLTAGKTGNGALTAIPSGGSETTCDPSCQLDLAAGTQVTLRASPAAGPEIAGWSGVSGCGAGDRACTFRVNDDLAVTVEFAQTAQLTVLKRGDGGGTVSGQGLSCDGKGCTGTYRTGTEVRLTADPDGRSRFAGWSGCSPAGATTCTVTVGGDTTVTATFDHVPDTTAPNIRMSAEGVTVTPTSGDRTVQMSGSNRSITFRATGTDSGSDVTETSILFGFIHATCENAAGETQGIIHDGFEKPIATSGDGSVQHTRAVNDSLCRDADFPTLVSAEGYYKAQATSEGGTATTDSLRFVYNR